MLEKLSLNALDCDNHSSKISIEPYNYSKETEKKCCERSLLRIIKTSIRIQVALSEILLLGNDPDCSLEGTVAFVYRDIKKEEAEQIEELKGIFSFVHKVHSEKGELVAFEVYSPKPVAIISFFRAYIQNDINPWIKVFFSQETIDDCKEPALYKYIPEHNKNHQILPQDDAFFNYNLNP